MSKICVLTSGGDSPGMNAAVVSIARNAALYGFELLGVNRGFNGLLQDDFIHFNYDTILDIADQPGTYLRTARCAEFKKPEAQDRAAKLLHEMDVAGVVIIGGDGSFKGAKALHDRGIPCIGIPGTIDNDLPYTEMTLGYDTAVNDCVDAVRAIRATSRSHDRPHVVEVMGRDCGDIALATAVATGAEIVVVPEVKNWKVDRVAARLNELIDRGNTRATVIVAEGCWKTMAPFDLYHFLHPYYEALRAKDPGCGKYVYPNEPMTADRFASVLKRKCGVRLADAKKMMIEPDVLIGESGDRYVIEARATVIGYTQRGCQPTARDAQFAFEAGMTAVRLIHRGVSGQLIGVRRGRTFYMPIDKALLEKRPFNRKLYNIINQL